MVIERKFINDKLREQRIKEYLMNYMDRVGFSHIDIQKTPVGFSIVIHSSKPGLVVGRRGINIREIKKNLKEEFELESPIVEVQEVSNPNLDPNIVAERVGNQLRRFGPSRFKAIGHKTIDKVMEAGAIGAEIKISGKVPSARSRSWKFYAGYLPKCGDVVTKEVKKGYTTIKLKPGVIGIVVKLLPPGVKMPDKIYLKEEDRTVKMEEEIEEKKVKKEEKKKRKKEKTKKAKKEQEKKDEKEETRKENLAEKKEESNNKKMESEKDSDKKIEKESED